jgi:hypothetical protein
MFVELRVHGVSGTPPVDMLDHPLVAQVAGDTDGRFFRPVDSAGAEVRAEDGHILEGYHWGPLTSGTWRQALWLVLIPFGLVNAAYFMLPGGGGTVARTVARSALRVLGIVVSVIVVLSLAQAAVDLLAWQWTGVGPRAGDPRWWLAGAFAVVVLALLVIRFVGGAPKALPDGDGWTPPAALVARTGLAGGEFYTGDRDMPALRHLHLGAGLTVLSVLAAAVGGARWLYWIALVLLAWTVVHAALVGDPTREREGVRKLFAGRLASVELGVAVAVLVAAVVVVVTAPGYPDRDRGVLPGTADLGRWAAGLALAALVVLVVSAAALAVRTRRPDVPRPFRRFLGGMVGPVVAALGMFVAVGFAAALDYGVLRLLRPSDRPDLMALPTFHLRIAFAAGAAVLLAVVIGVVLAVVMTWSATRYERMVRASAGQDLLPDNQVRSVARAWWLARVKFAVHWLAITVAVAGTVLTVAAVVEAGNATECVPGGTWLSDCRDLPGLDLVTLGTATVLALGGFLVYLGRRAVGDSAVRRAACVVWDVVAFWPAAVHPFVPPPYSPKVVEDLRRRIAWHLGYCYELAPLGACTCALPAAPAPFLVLAGHSQGSLIAAAALTRLAPACREQVALLTFGSQLQIAYARAFPAYVNHDFLCWLRADAAGGRWLSLYRETDPIGGPVQSWDRTDAPAFTSWRLGGACATADETDPRSGIRRCGTEWRLLDPQPGDGQRVPRTAMRRHSSYTVDPAWPAALAELAAFYRRSASTASAARRPETSAP